MNKTISRDLGKDSKMPFSNALLLARHEDVAMLDRRALRDAGIRNIKVFTEGLQAARSLAESCLKLNRIGETDVILCHEKLADMTGEEFVRLIRLHPLLENFPIIVAVDTNTKSVQNKVLEYANACLPRPYTVAGLLNQLAIVAELIQPEISSETKSTAFDTALQYFTRQTLLRTQNAEQNYRDGFNLVKSHQWDEAIGVLNYAIRQNPNYGDAYLGLAAAWRGKGNIEKCLQMLNESLTAFVTANAFERAKMVNDKIMQQVPGASPLYAEAKRRIAASEFELAAKTIEVSPPQNTEESKDLSEQVAKGCLASPNPEEAIAGLNKHLTEQNLSGLGSSLEVITRKKIEGVKSGIQPAPFQSSWTQTDKGKKNNLTAGDFSTASTFAEAVPAIALLKEPVPSDTLKKFPMLCDALSVAKVTLGLFKVRKR